MSAAMVQAVLEAPKQVHGRALVEAQEAGPWQSPGGGSGSRSMAEPWWRLRKQVHGRALVEAQEVNSQNALAF